MTTISDPMRAKIRTLRGHLRRLFALDGTARVLSTAVALVTGAVALDWLLNLPGAVRLVLLTGIIAAVGLLLLRRLVQPMLFGMGDEDLALTVEQRFPGLHDRLISTVEFTRPGQEKGYFGSPAMVDMVIEETWRQAGEMDFRKGLRTRGIARMAQTAALLLTGFVLALAWSNDARIGMQRLLMPFSDARWPQRTFIDEVSPGSVPHEQGKDLEVRVQFSGRLPSKSWIDYHSVETDTWQSRRMTPLEGGTFFTVFRAVSGSFVYRLRGGDAESDTFTVTALERIRIWDKTLSYDYRDYTKLKDREVTGAGGAIRAPVGTRVHVRATTSKPIAEMVVELSGVPTADFLARTAPAVIEGEITLRKPEPREQPSYRIRLTDLDGLKNHSEPYSIRAEEDRPPSVRIEEPASRDLSVTAGAAIPLKVVCEDGFGLQDGELRWVLTREGQSADEETRPLFRSKTAFGENTETTQLTWDLAELKLQVGDSINFYAASRDFCDFPEPNVGKSEVFRLNVLSVKDYLDEMQRRQQRHVLKELEVAADIQDKNIKVSEEIAAALDTDKKLSDKDKARLLGVEMAQKQVTQRASKAGEWASKLRAELLNNRQGDSDVARELNLTADKLDEMTAGNLPKAESDITGARTADDDRRPAELKKALDTEKDVKKDLDSMVNRLRQWQSLAELRKRAEKLLKDQQTLNSQTLDVYKEVFGKALDNDEKEKLRNLGTVQRELKGELTMLLEDMVKSAAELASRSPQQAQLLAHAQNEAKAVDIEKTMLDAAGHLSESLLGRASDEQEMVEAGLKELVKNLSEAAEQDRAQRELQKKLAEIAKELDKAIAKERNILAGTTEGASGLQNMLNRIEQAIKDVRGMEAGQADATSGAAGASTKPDDEKKRSLEELTRKQRELQKDADKTGNDVGEIERDAPKITPDEAKKALGDAKGSLGQASKSMGQASQGMQQAASGQESGQQPGQGQQQAQKNLGDAEKQLTDAKDAVKKALERELDRLKKEQDRNKELADRIKHELDKLRKDQTSDKLDKASQNTASASQNMQNASSQLGQQGGQSGQGGQGGKQGNMQQAQQDEQKALDDLNRARDQVAQEQDQFEDDDLEEKLLEIETELKKMLTLQLEVNVGTIALDKVVKLEREMTRKEERDLVDATERQRAVSERAVEVKKTLEDEKIPVFAWAVGEVASDTNALVARISRKDTGLVTQKMQDTVVRTLKDLIDALQRERRQRQQQGGGGGGGGGGGAQRIVPPLAELKMIRTMHKRVSDETGDFDDALRKGDVRQDDVKSRVTELADKEKNIGKLLKDLMDALSEQQP